jgi:tRNA nucleotidyltransferase (CCA-adding enzyme)
MDEATLIEKLLKIKAMFAGAATEGERTSAKRARQRILQRLAELLPEDPPVEYKFTFRDMWSRKVFVTLLRRYGLNPDRYRGQRYTTVMVQVPERFVAETLWPEFQKINAELSEYLQEVTDRVIKKVLYEDSSDVIIVDRPLQLDEGPEQKSVSGKQATFEDLQSGKASNSQPLNKSKKKKKTPEKEKAQALRKKHSHLFKGEALRSRLKY